MLLYNFKDGSNIFDVSKAKGKKDYKSTIKVERDFISAKALDREGWQKSPKKKKRKNKISQKNIKFLEGLGLKVKKN